MTNDIWNMITTYYITSPVWLVLTVLSIVYIFYASSRDARKKMVGCAVLAFAILLNDLSYRVLTKIFDAASYYRFLWCLPYVMIVTYAILLCVRQLKEKRDNVVLAIFVVSIGFLLYYTQTSMMSRLKADMPQNKYEVSDDMLELRDIFAQERMMRQSEDEIIMACPLDVMLQYQTIDAECIMVTGRNTYLLTRDSAKTDITQCGQAEQDAYLLSTICQDSEQPDATTVRGAMERQNIEFMIVHADVGLEEYMETLGCVKEGQTTSYLVYHYDVAKQSSDAKKGQDVEDIKQKLCLHEDQININLQLPKEHKIVTVNDMHIISMDESVEEEYKDTVLSRRDSLFLNEGTIPSNITWNGMASILDSYDAEGIVFIGDMIDYNAQSNLTILQQGLDQIRTPYIYLRADHDLGIWYTDGKRLESDAIEASSQVAHWEEVYVNDYSDFYLVGWNNSTSQLTESGLKTMQDIFAKAKKEGKPIILATHVPINSLIDDSLKRAAQETDSQGRAKLWGEGCLYQPNETTGTFLQMVVAEDSPVKAVLAGHLHFKYTVKLNENITEYVLDKGFGGNVGIVNVT